MTSDSSAGQKVGFDKGDSTQLLEWDAFAGVRPYWSYHDMTPLRHHDLEAGMT